MQNKIDLTKEIALISFDADLSSCIRVTDDLTINKDGKPVDKGATVTIPVFDLQETNGLKTNRERVRRYLQRVGISFAGAYIVAKTDVPEVMKKCMNFVDQFNAEKHLLLMRYDDLLQKFIDGYPVEEVKPIIKKKAWSSSEFASKHSLEMLPPMSLGASDEDGNEKLKEKIAQAAFDDVRTSAFNIFKKKLTDSNNTVVKSISQSPVRDCHALKDKVKKLSFLHEGMGNLLQGFDDVLGTLPKVGKIEGHHLTNLVHLVHSLRDKDAMIEICNGVRKVTLQQDVDWVEADTPKKESVQPISSTKKETAPAENSNDSVQDDFFEGWN